MRLAVPRLLKDKVEHFIYRMQIPCVLISSMTLTALISATSFVQSATILSIFMIQKCQTLGPEYWSLFQCWFLYINIENWIKFDIENKANTVLFEQGKALPYFDQMH